MKIKSWSKFFENNIIDDELFSYVLDVTKDFEEDKEFTCEVSREISTINQIRIKIRDHIGRFYTLPDIEQYIETLKSYIQNYENLKISVLIFGEGLFEINEFMRYFQYEEFYELMIIIHTNISYSK